MHLNGEDNVYLNAIRGCALALFRNSHWSFYWLALSCGRLLQVKYGLPISVCFVVVFRLKNCSLFDIIQLLQLYDRHGGRCVKRLYESEGFVTGCMLTFCSAHAFRTWSLITYPDYFSTINGFMVMPIVERQRHSQFRII